MDFSHVSDNATMQNICLVANADSFKYVSDKLFVILNGSVSIMFPHGEIYEKGWKLKS